MRIDSLKGRLRAMVKSAPDVPVSKVIVQMQGGKKGLFVDSTNQSERRFSGGYTCGRQTFAHANLHARITCTQNLRGKDIRT